LNSASAGSSLPPATKPKARPHVKSLADVIKPGVTVEV
jgi:hypothetical protein